ncbi:unnamed protein product [Candida verbasci]|uniref:Uncharacterized protein n=1 Tax=Candida verbasci TaxID=1227364 RepID=A0A9W4XAH4_9ASCO|nr:unnamed protein product [Candida verbasci]
MSFKIYNNEIAYLIDNEIKFYKLDNQGQINQTGQFKYDENILDFIWTSYTTQKKSSKGSKQSSQYAILVYKEDEFILLSSVGEIKKYKGFKIDKLINFENDSIWALQGSNLIEIKNGKVSSKIETDFTNVKLNKNQVIGITESTIEFGKIQKDKFILENKYDATANEILELDYFAFISDNEVYVMKDNLEKLETSDVKSGQFINLQDEYLVIIESGVIKFYQFNKLIHSIKGDVDGIISNKNSLYVIWKGKNNLKFKQIEITALEIEIETNGIKQDEVSISVPANKVNNLDSERILKQLDLTDKQKTIELCLTQDDQDTIKEVVKTLSLQQAQDLYLLLIDQLKLSINLNYWIKWIYLIYGNSLDIGSTILINSSNSLNESMKLLPHLLSIKGKLELRWNGICKW